MSLDQPPEADLHCHILPSWDDGARSLEESVEMAQKFVAAGVKKVLVTPHVGRRLRNIVEKPSRDIVGAAASLQQELASRGIEIELIPASELTMDSEDLASRLESEPWLTVGGQGHYALIESTYNRWPRYGDQFMQQVFFAGVTPIIAHPERYRDVQKDPMILRKAFEMGALIQVTARSLAMDEDKAIRACSIALLKSNMVSIVASDAHNPRAVLPAEVVSLVRGIVGEQETRRIFHENPRKILHGDPVYNPDIRTQKAGVLGSLMAKFGRPARA